jgi:hypothetical protein
MGQSVNSFAELIVLVALAHGAFRLTRLVTWPDNPQVLAQAVQRVGERRKLANFLRIL